MASGHRTTSWGLGTGGTGALYSNAAWQTGTSSSIERAGGFLRKALAGTPGAQPGDASIVWNLGVECHNEAESENPRAPVP